MLFVVGMYSVRLGESGMDRKGQPTVERKVESSQKRSL